MLKIKDIMTTEVFVLHATQTLELVRSLMRIKHVRHVPIVDRRMRIARAAARFAVVEILKPRQQRLPAILGRHAVRDA